jgi:hypothetical protein
VAQDKGGAAVGPGGPAGADVALRPEDDADFWAPRAMIGAEELGLALRAKVQGGEKEPERARRAAA